MKIVISVDSAPRARKWANYAVDSLLKYRPSDFTVNVISDTPYKHDGVAWIDAIKYIKMFGLNEIAKNHHAKYFDGNPWSPMTFIRLFIPLMDEFKEEEKILYTDCDVEIIDKRFFSIADMPLLGKDVIGVVDTGRCGRPRWKEYLHDNQIDAFCKRYRGYDHLKNERPFNSGVMIMGVQNILGRKVSYFKELQKVIKFVQEHGLYTDQAICNILFDLLPCSTAYNALHRINNPSDGVYCIHYAGQTKLTGEYPNRIIRNEMVAQNRN